MLRPAVPGDIPKIARIYWEDLRRTYAEILPQNYFDSQTLEAAVETWTRILNKPDSIVLVWQEGDAVAGVTGINRGEKEWELASLYVDENHQGRGIGKALLREALRLAKKAGAEGMAISVVLANQRAKGLYERQGAVFQNEFTYCFGEYPVACGRYLWTL